VTVFLAELVALYPDSVPMSELVSVRIPAILREKAKSTNEVDEDVLAE